MVDETSQELLEQFQQISEKVITCFRNDDNFRTQAIEASSEDFSKSPAELAGATVAAEVGIFRIMSAHNAPMTLFEITDAARGNDLRLVTRITRLLAAHGMVDQVSPTQYVANEFTHDYATPAREGNLYTQLHTMMAFAALPWHLREIGWKNSTDAKNCAFQHGMGRSETMWQWMKGNEEMGMHFNNFMTGSRTLKSDDLADIYPFKQLFAGSQEEDVVFVDVGGGLGHQCLNIRKTFPPARGRVILQDLAQVVEGKELVDVEVMAHDMLTEQPIKGARAYYFRGVLHDHNDDVCRAFLRQTVRAMDSESRLLVHDQIVEAMKPSQFVTRMDLGMMALFGGGERSAEEMWELLESVGLKIVGSHQPEPRQWTITEAVLA